jgi:3-oxoacyl-[acyl-carrier-protein] synthase-3
MYIQAFDSQADIGIPYLACSLPEAMPVSELGRRSGKSGEWAAHFEERHGLRNIHVAVSETPAGMAAAAARRVLESADIDSGSIGAVVLFHTFYLLAAGIPHLVSELQKQLNLRNSVGFSVTGQHCASIVSALRIARNMLAAGSAANVLLVGADYFGGSLVRELSDISLQGEAASAALMVRHAARNRIVALSNYADGSFYQGAAAGPERFRAFDNVYFLILCRLIRRTLDKCKLTLQDISLIIPHNVNCSSWIRIAAMLKIPETKVFMKNVAKCGHLCSSDWIANLTEAAADHALEPGDLILLVTVGLGAGWGCMVIRH